MEFERTARMRMCGARGGRAGSALVALGIAGMLLGGCAHISPVQADRIPTQDDYTSHPSPATTTVGCVTYTSDGNQVWTHPYRGAQLEIADPLQKIADTHPDAVAGTAYCSDYAGLAIFVKKGSRQVLDEVDALKRRMPTARIDVHEVPHSMNEMLHFIDLIPSGEAPMIGVLSPNIYTGGLTLGIADAGHDEEARKAVKQFIGDIPVSIYVTDGVVTPLPTLPTSTTTTVGCVTYTSEGEQVWTHPYVGDQREIAAPLEEIANTHPDEVAGTAYCSDYVGLAIFVKHGSPAVLHQIDALKQKLPDARIDVHEVPHALNEMLHFIDLLGSDETATIGALRPNIYTGGLTIGISDAADEDRARRIVRELVGDIPVAIQVTRTTFTPMPKV